jgi:hypothetical protein
VEERGITEEGDRAFGNPRPAQAVGDADRRADRILGVEPLAHALEVHNVFREDEPRPSLPVDEALANAPDWRGVPDTTKAGFLGRQPTQADTEWPGFTIPSAATIAINAARIGGAAE